MITIDNCNKVLADLDELENKRNLSIPEGNFWNILKKHLIRLLAYQKEYWKKCCTIRWIKFSDENTKFFQAVATERYRRNNIASFQNDEGDTIEDHPGKEALLFQTYKEPTEMKFNLQAIIKRAPNLNHLTDPFTHVEIDAVVKEMLADRAPGPDGFSGAFLKACWPIIRHDFYTLCAQFHEGGLDLTSINDGLITLIPKINSP